MTGTADVFANKWWKFDEYEIRDGCLCPTPDASLSDYHPWEAYEELLAKDSSERPYKTLIDLADRITKDPRNPCWPTGDLCPENTAALSAWAAESGLLGLLLQRSLRVVRAPRWVSDATTRKVLGLGGQVQGLVGAQMTSMRTPTGWTTSSRLQIRADESSSPASTDLTLEGQLVAASDIPRDWGPPSVLVQQDDYSLVVEPLDGAWGRFFPSVSCDEKTTYDYPRPLTNEFWAVYAEPVGDLLQAAISLGETARQVTRLQHLSDKEQMALEDWDLRGIRLAPARLAQLASSLAPNLRSVDDVLRLTWTGPSLISLLAMMIVLDLTSRMRLHRCNECHGLFVSPSSTVRYCSERCRWKRQKRRQREGLGMAESKTDPR